eukprot:3099638-Pyramimonas_sp.AAC.1
MAMNIARSPLRANQSRPRVNGIFLDPTNRVSRIRGIFRLLGLDADAAEQTVKTLLSRLFTGEFDSPVDSLRTSLCRPP